MEGNSNIIIDNGGINSKYLNAFGNTSRSIMNKAHKRFQTSRIASRKMIAINSSTNIIFRYLLHH